MHDTFRFRDRRLTVTLQRAGDGGRFVASIDDATAEVKARLLDSSTLRVLFEGRSRRVRVARTAQGYQVAIGGEVYLLAPESGATAETAALASPQITAPMPGKVTDVLVHEGQEVAAGDGLVILEAMKMENRLTAEAPAVVRKVHVEAGQMVDGGAVLVELEYVEGKRDEG
jgi:acetyl/propionyl-CoA carboxylase alpha subunit